MKMQISRVMVGLAAVALVLSGGCSDEDPVAPADATPPNTVTDLRVQAISDVLMTVAWTAPGDDGASGKADQYDIRYSASAITAGNWATCTPVPGVPVPADAGTEQTININATVGPEAYVALKAADEVPNWSGLSNVVHGAFGAPFVVHQLTTEGNNIQPCLNDGVVTWVRANSVTGDEIYAANLDSAHPSPTPMTDNGGQKAHPSSHGTEKIVWQGRGGGGDDWEIFTYSPHQIPRFSAFTDNDVPDLYPVLAGAGHFAWLQGYVVFEEVHYWNESLHRESVISDGCCPNTQYGNERPTADDFSVAWRTYDRDGTGGPRTMLWRGVVTDLTAQVDAIMAHNFSLHEDALAYEWGASPATITYWNGGAPQSIAEGYEPSLYSGTIAYEVWDGQDWEIHFWNGSTILEITDNDFNDTRPSLYGNLIAWVGRPPSSADHIFYAKLLGKSTQP